MPKTDRPIDDVLPAIEALDAALLQNNDQDFSPSLVEDTAADIAAEHNLPTDELLEHFTLFVVISTPEPEDNKQYHQQLLNYLTTHHND